MLHSAMRFCRSAAILLVWLLVLASCGQTRGTATQGDPNQIPSDREDPETAEQQQRDPTEGGSRQPDEITFALNWLPVGDSVPWFSALDRGYFSDENLDVEIVRGFGSGDTVQRIATGEAQFGIADLSAIVPLRVNEDAPVLAIASVFAEPPHVLVFRAGDGIEEPRDLEGRSIACTPASASLLMFPAFAEATGIDADAVDWKLSDPASVVPAFASGQADASCDFIGGLPLIEDQTDDQLDYFSYAEHGVSGHSVMIIAAERTVEERPDLVERFARAALRGVEFAVDNPEGGVEILRDYAPDNDPDIIHDAWMIFRDFMVSEDTERHGFGHISDERMTAAFDTLVEATDIDVGNYTVDDVYTTDYLP